ncbi:MAG: cation:proton antiporter [Candidatus Roizmanbacteria bacterium]|nr:cation:proton antiporter [Candidatus Roizmanbacteria bacterium]
MTVFSEIGAILFLAVAIAAVMRLLKQPLIVGHILTGLIVGPYALNLLHSTQTIEVFSQFGVTVLLFIVGLHLSPKVIKEVGKVSLFAGLAQVVVTFIVGLVVVRLLGFGFTTAAFIAIALTFSSTIVVLKYLADKGDLDKFYGKVTIGILLLQDIVATILMVVLPALGNAGDQQVIFTVLFVLMKGILLVAALYIFSQFVLSKIASFLAYSQEFLFLFSIAWGVGLAALFQIIGFSLEIGALVAGVTLSITPYAYEISSRLKPLRDFFVVLFFILLGSHIQLPMLGQQLVPAIVLSLFVLIGNPFIVFYSMNLLGYNRRVNFLTGISLAQISEFSLIFMSIAYTSGFITSDVVSLVTLVGLITIPVSTYFILYGNDIYRFFSPLLARLEIRKTHKSSKNYTATHDTLLFGYDRVGEDFVNSFKKLGKRFLVIDFNPESIRRLEGEGILYKYGDAQDVEFLEELGLANMNLVVSTIADIEANTLLVRHTRMNNKKAIIIVLSQRIDEAIALYEEGATYVLMPHYLGAQYAARMLVEFSLDFEKFERARSRHMEYLKKRYK